MIRAASREALAELEQKANEVAGPAGVDALPGIATDLYEVAAVLTVQPQLRRLLGDAAATAERRTELVQRIFTGKVGAPASAIVDAAVGLRWSTPWDLTDGIELAGDRLLMDAAEQQSRLDAVEDEVFRFGRILDANDGLRSLLDEQIVPSVRRAELLRGVLSEKVDPITLQLLDQAVRTTRKRSIMLAIDDLLDQAAARRERSTAVVRTAVALTEEQVTRLVAALAELYGREIDVRAEVDPAVRGGLVIRVGDEVIDGSVAGRLAAVRAALAY